MGKLFAGMVLSVAGTLAAIEAFFMLGLYVGTQDLPDQLHSEYQLFSLLFFILSVGLVLGGMYITVFSIRKINHNYRASKTNTVPVTS
jgi:uncharacterized membrane protein YciS (DUF1049 family)